MHGEARSQLVPQIYLDNKYTERKMVFFGETEMKLLKNKINKIQKFFEQMFTLITVRELNPFL